MRLYKDAAVFFAILLTIAAYGWLKTSHIPVKINDSKVIHVRYGTQAGEILKKSDIELVYNQAIWNSGAALYVKKRKAVVYIDGKKADLNTRIYAPCSVKITRKLVSSKPAETYYKIEDSGSVVRGKGPFIKLEEEGYPVVYAVYRLSSDEVRRLAFRGKPAVLKRTDGVNEKVIALTFDDGPSPYTPALLNVLKKYNVKATFFFVGLQIQRYPGIASMVSREGHLIGNHTFHHVSLKHRPSWVLEKEIMENQNLIKKFCGVSPVWVRPPYMFYDSFLISYLKSKKFEVSFWTIDSEDWKHQEAEIIYRNVMANLKPGSVILMHDGGGKRIETILATERIIREARKKGYVFVTLADFSKLKKTAQ